MRLWGKGRKCARLGHSVLDENNQVCQQALSPTYGLETFGRVGVSEVKAMIVHAS